MKLPRLKNRLRTWAIVIGLGILAIVIALALRSDKQQTARTATVTRTKVTDSVAVTGRIVPIDHVDLAFEVSGRITHIPFRVGAPVKEGDVLVALRADDTIAELAQTEAAVRIQNATLADLLRGSRPEEITIAETKVTNARATREEALANLRDRVEDGYVRADDAVRTKTDELFSNPRGTSPELIMTVRNAQLEQTVESERYVTELLLINWQETLQRIPSPALSDLTEHATRNLMQIKQYLDDLALARNYVAADASSLSLSTLEGYRNNISTARTNVQTAIINLTAAKEKLHDAESAVRLAEEELALTRAGTATEEIEAQRARVEEARANANRIRAKLEKMTLRAPFNGIVTAVHGEIGELAATNVTIISLNSDGAFKIEANIPEADIAGIQSGAEALVTLDAYRDEALFPAHVSSIDPAETLIEGVATYKTTILLTEKDDRIRSGMTADIDIIVAKRTDVLAIPAHALFETDGNSAMVRIQKDGVIQEIRVVTGLHGSDGMVEIIEGLAEGDHVVVSASE